MFKFQNMEVNEMKMASSLPLLEPWSYEMVNLEQEALGRLCFQVK